MPRISRHIAVFVFAIIAMPISFAQTSASDSLGIREVWSKEDAYWRYVQAGDYKNYMTLWHDEFMGWPASDEHPATKATIGDWVREIGDQKIKYDYTMTREGSRQFGNIVIVYYRVKSTSTYPDGHADPEATRKLTHTWLKVGTTWKIIGGMAGFFGNTRP